jgi:hypothetical protein
MAEVILADPDAEGLDSMLAGLLRGAITDPSKAKILDAMSGTVTIAVPDAEVEVGLRFGQGICRVLSSGIPGAKVRIEIPSEDLLAMSTIPLLAGLPSVRTKDGRAFQVKLLKRQIRIRGMRHLRLITQLNKLLSLA